MFRRWAGWVWEGCRQAARCAVRRPGFAAGVVLTLGLGVGANVAMFEILDRLLFRPPAHVREHEQVVRVMVLRNFLGKRSPQASISFPDYQDFARPAAFRAVAGYSPGVEQTLGRGAEATRVRAASASHGFFGLLGVSPALGRFFGPDDDRIGAAPTAVLGYEYWRSAMARDPQAIGRTIEVAGNQYTIVGVAPRGFTGVDLTSVDVWLPLETAQGLVAGTQWHDNRDFYWMRAIARLGEGASAGAAEQEATALHRAGRRDAIDRGRYDAEASVQLTPLILARGPQASAESRVARWLGGVSLLVLLIACANVANLLFANSSRGRRDVAVRLALGVDRRQLVVQSVVESVLLALAGGAVALLFAVSAGRLIRAALLPDVVFGGVLTGRLLGFTAVVAAIAGLIAGAGPALQGSRADLTGDLVMGAGRMAARRSRARAALTVAQAALSVVLLVGAGLFLRSVARVRAVDLGLDVDQLVLASLEFDAALIPGTTAPPAAEVTRVRNELYAAALARVAAVPGVQAAAATDSPFQFARLTDLGVPGLDSIPKLPGGGPYVQDVTPGYLGTVGLRVLRGRDFTEIDDANAQRVAVVSETMARTLWPDREAVGSTLLLDQAKTPFVVVGVVEDASRGGIGEDPFMTYYLPVAQRPRRLDGVYARVARGAAEDEAAAIAPVLRSLDSRVRYATVRPLRDALDPQARSWTLGATLFTVFGALALTVAAVGLYGVLAFDVEQRTREIGIRSALGAEKRQLLGAVVRDGVSLAAVGIAIGLTAALAAAPYVKDLLFDESPRDPAVFLLVAGVLLVTALLASFLPALRATRVDPIVALRAD